MKKNKAGCKGRAAMDLSIGFSLGGPLGGKRVSRDLAEPGGPADMQENVHRGAAWCIP